MCAPSRGLCRPPAGGAHRRRRPPRGASQRRAILPPSPWSGSCFRGGRPQDRGTFQRISAWKIVVGEHIEKLAAVGGGARSELAAEVYMQRRVAFTTRLTKVWRFDAMYFNWLFVCSMGLSMYRPACARHTCDRLLACY